MGGRTWVAGPWRTTISHADVDTKEVYELDLQICRLYHETIFNQQAGIVQHWTPFSVLILLLLRRFQCQYVCFMHTTAVISRNIDFFFIHEIHHRYPRAIWQIRGITNAIPIPIPSPRHHIFSPS